MSAAAVPAPAVVQQPDAAPLPIELAGHAVPAWPRPDDADVHLDLLVADKLSRIRQPSAAHPSVHDRRWHTLTVYRHVWIPVDWDKGGNW